MPPLSVSNSPRSWFGKSVDHILMLHRYALGELRHFSDVLDHIFWRIFPGCVEDFPGCVRNLPETSRWRFLVRPGAFPCTFQGSSEKGEVAFCKRTKFKKGLGLNV